MCDKLHSGRASSRPTQNRNNRIRETVRFALENPPRLSFIYESRAVINALARLCSSAFLHNFLQALLLQPDLFTQFKSTTHRMRHAINCPPQYVKQITLFFVVAGSLFLSSSSACEQFSNTIPFRIFVLTSTKIEIAIASDAVRNYLFIY